MASKEDIAKQYAKEIIESQNQLEKIEEIENLINGLIYESTKLHISEEDKEYIWECIEKELERLENQKIKKIGSLYEQTNKSTLDVISLVRGKKKKKK